MSTKIFNETLFGLSGSVSVSSPVGGVFPRGARGRGFNRGTSI